MNIDPIPFRLVAGSPTELRLKKFLSDRVKSCRQSLEKLHGNDGIIKWRKAYEAVPATEVREFPWHNASNLVVPIVAIHSDTLLARVMSSVMKTRPLWVTRMIGEFGDAAPAGLRDALEEFLQYVGLEPQELNLYQVYHEWFGEAIRLGTSVLKCPWIKQVEDVMGPAGDLSGKNGWSRVVKYEGPKPEKLKYENFKYPVNKPTIEDMDFKYDVITLEKYDLEERKYRNYYDSAAVDAVLLQPDRTSSQTQVQAQKEKDAKVSTISGYGFAEYDVCECHFKYRVERDRFTRVIVWYHEKSNTILRSFYHYYPDEIYIAARLFYRDDMFPGMGFGEILLPFQEEISTIHNDRRNNMTVANTKMWAVDPDSKLHKGYRTHPGAMLPAKQTAGQKEIEALDQGTPVQGEIDSERLSLELAEKRSGVSPPMQGAGAGGNSKRGIYTAMGTLSVMQEGNTRTDLNITDIKYAHTRVGRVLGGQYAKFGIGDRKEMFGKLGVVIEQALDAIRDGKMALPVYAASASVNREVEKQSDLMLSGVMAQYHERITGMLTAVSNPMMDPKAKEYTLKAIESAQMFMTSVLRHFGYDEVDRLAPKPNVGPPGGEPSAGGAGGSGVPQQQRQLPSAAAPGMIPPAVLPERVM